MIVRDIMNSEVEAATPATSIRDVAILMCFNKISGVPVVEGDKIVGIISEKDILHAMYPGVDEFMQSGSFDFEALEGSYQDILNQSVGDLMVSNVLTVAPDVPVLKAVSIMCLNRIRRIPVADGDRLVGIISIGDVHKAIFTQNLDTAALRLVQAPQSSEAGLPSNNLM